MSTQTAQSVSDTTELGFSADQSSPIITNDQLNHFTTAWKTQVMGNNLTQYLFQKETPQSQSYQYLIGYTFPVQDIIKLVSTPGIQNIYVSFGINEKGWFTLILTGYNALNTVVSAHYVGTPKYKNYAIEITMSDQKEPAQIEGFVDGCVPTGLAKLWRTYWINQLKDQLYGNPLINGIRITHDIYSTPYGFLQGYLYPLNDFMDTLFPITSFNKEFLDIDFCLHQYYNPEGNLALTFGLVMQMKPNGSSDSEVLYYDLSAPCPPTCPNDSIDSACKCK